jgi:hypothetical protein
MANAITVGWKELFGVTPSKQQVAMVLAQNALETGHRKSMWNYNVGNIITNGNDSYDYFDDLTTDEQIKPGTWKKMNLKYRAYPSLDAGVKDYLKFISGKKYSGAWKHILNPDPVAFSKALKSAGYYTVNEAAYTKTLSKLYDQYSGSTVKSKIPLSNIPQNDNNLSNIIDNYLQMVAASEKSNKKLYKQFLPYHKFLIKIESQNYTDSIEFARIACTALEEELLAKAYTHTNGQCVEIECEIPGPQKECINLTREILSSVEDAFCAATKKIGGIVIATDCITNTISSYQQISFKQADFQREQFLLKFNKGQ